MQHPLNFLDNIDDRVTSFVSTFNEFLPEDLGLDRRAGYRFYVDSGYACIAIQKRDDKTLQYYGGFEYVDKEFRREVGNWVFYFDEDSRVSRAISYLNEGVE